MKASELKQLSYLLNKYNYEMEELLYINNMYNDEKRVSLIPRYQIREEKSIKKVVDFLSNNIVLAMTYLCENNIDYDGISFILNLYIKIEKTNYDFNSNKILECPESDNLIMIDGGVLCYFNKDKENKYTQNRIDNIKIPSQRFFVNKNKLINELKRQGFRYNYPNLENSFYKNDNCSMAFGIYRAKEIENVKKKKLS